MCSLDFSVISPIVGISLAAVSPVVYSLIRLVLPTSLLPRTRTLNVSATTSSAPDIPVVDDRDLGDGRRDILRAVPTKI